MNDITRKSCEKIRNNINIIENIITNIDDVNNKSEKTKKLINFLKTGSILNLYTIQYKTCAELEEEDKNDYKEHGTPEGIDNLVQNTYKLTELIKKVLEDNLEYKIPKIYLDYKNVIHGAIKEKIINEIKI